MPPPAAGGGDGRGALMDAIRTGGGGLKKAGDRPAPAAPPPADERGALMDAIRSGNTRLKKVDTNAPKPAAAAPMSLGGVSVAAILARRQALADSGDEDSDDEDWED